eukprot:augustus_masked-scaffold_3-processed-gene-19.11-mRNA-1 protein AED:0.03 eAED:0.03 QI:0/0/0/1/1/1/2/0/813
MLNTLVGYHVKQRPNLQEPHNKDMSFAEKVRARFNTTNSLLCVGIDPHEHDLQPFSDSENPLWSFSKHIINETKHVALCYKPNLAFFESEKGLKALVKISEYLNPDIPVLLDGKRGDISSTADAYAKSAAQHLKGDAVTINPLMGFDAVKPFMDKNLFVFLLCKTSNPSSNDFQLFHNLFLEISSKAETWDQGKNQVGLVCGATDCESIKRIRKNLDHDLVILAPGIGAQSGDLRETMFSAIQGTQFAAGGSDPSLIIPISRGISRAPTPKEAAEKFAVEISEILSEIRSKAISDEVEMGGNEEKFYEISLNSNVLQIGDFTLKSGRKSPYFFNAGKFSSASDFTLLSECYAQKLLDSNVEFDVIFGPAYKGIPLAAAISLKLFEKGKNISFGYNRKEIKNHGEGGNLVGAVKNKNVVLVDDVITSGKAIREVINLVEKEGGKVVCVVIAFDREEKTLGSVSGDIAGNLQQKGEKNLSAVKALEEEFQIKVLCVGSLSGFINFMEKNDKKEADLSSLKEYRSKYGDGGGASHLARIHGTEEDRVNCPFYFKIGACRHGDGCSRMHNKPNFSQTILIRQMYENPLLLKDPMSQYNSTGHQKGYRDQPDDDDFEDFYFDIFEELAKFGELEEVIVCDNLCEHLLGNVYVKYYDEEDADQAQKKLNGRFFAGKQLKVEFSPVTDFREAKCRQYHDNHCGRGFDCNFIHTKRIGSRLSDEMFRVQKYHYKRSRPDVYKRRRKERVRRKEKGSDVSDLESSSGSSSSSSSESDADDRKRRRRRSQHSRSESRGRRERNGRDRDEKDNRERSRRKRRRD